ncbi:MAG: HlyD family secretion protein [endosymbiont of Galathealinum brachiosum]|uniref:HlyD family secretion protein n=1 Tax=endosymbiont of Galathealinum brachiosum TaxID=2200906 RepID=A0A370DDV2_9GAMM|nr:MAG: HlyD family secretion protein [endosymbiont of Galathealinum brachiosum]
MSEEKSVTSDTQELDPVRKVTRYMLYVVMALFVWYIAADRISPWTDQARVQAFIIPVVPEVSGKIVDINIKKDQVVQPGDLLLSIDASDYELAVEVAETALELAGQETGARTALVSTAQAKLVEAETNLNHIKTQSARVFELEKEQVLSQSDGDKARAAVKNAYAQLDSAKANLEKEKQALGKKGNENPRIRAALSDLKIAQLNLSRTKIVAPSFGGITNLLIDVGYYANTGAPVMTFIEFNNVWIQADFRENNLANMKPGDSVEILLDVAPGEVFSGTVSTIGFAVNNGKTGNVGDLATVKGKSGWLREAQRFPVIISFDNDERLKGLRRLGGQADVLVYTGNNWVINPLGWVWMRVLSLFSYVY